MSAFFASAKTTIAGVLVLLCSGATFTGILPDKYSSLVGLFCGVAVAFGLIAAKDANVTNASNPTTPTVVKP